VASAKGVPTVALISQSNTLSQADLDAYVAPYQAYVDDWITKQYPAVGAKIVSPADGQAPTGAWIMYYQDGLDQPGAAGFHTDTRNRPEAHIDTGQDPRFTGSHELAEMLVDPTGNSLYVAPSPDPADNGKQVEILDEVCDPCEDQSFAIQVDGIPLSDFITPAFGNGTSRPYDVADKLTSPREIGINGYISWIDEQQGVWKQATNFQGQGFQVRVLGPAEQPKKEGKSLREWVDEQTRSHMVECGVRLYR
jgi:hypothetical protein